LALPITLDEASVSTEENSAQGSRPANTMTA
jgi:hypothetical protein